jgi:hypothetical protein
MSPWETTPAMINKNLAIELCDAINNDPSCLWVALRPPVPLGGGGRGGERDKTQTDFIVGYLNLHPFSAERAGLGVASEAYTRAFSQTSPGDLLPLTGRQSTGSFRIKLVYVGPPSATQSVFADFSVADVEADPRNLTANTKFNLLRRGAFQGGLGGLTPKATISIDQTFSSLAGTSGYFTDSTGTVKLYSSLSTIGVKTVQSSGILDTLVDTPFGVPSQTRGLYGGIENAEEGAAVTVDKKPSQFFLMAPEYYTGSATQIAQNRRYPYFSFDKKIAASDTLYSRGMHNFLAEIPAFFLEGEKLTSFASAPEDQFEAMEAGKTYYMDVSLYKTKDLNTVLSPQGRLGDRSVGYADGKYFGPAFKYKNSSAYGHPRELIADPAQAPYTPSYFYGKTTARLSFTATESRKYTLDEIFAGLQTEEQSEDVRKYFNQVVRSQRVDTTSLSHTAPRNIENCESSPAYAARMPLASSINLAAKGKIKNVAYELGATQGDTEQFVAATATDSNASTVDAWIISTKFESPVLNFNNTANKDHLRFRSASLEPLSEGIGMWSGYGEIPKKENGVFLELNYSFKLSKGDRKTLTQLDNVGSLIDVCKFTASTQAVGKVAEEKTISEAIILVPFLDDKQSSGPRTFTVEGKEVFAIDEDIYRYQKNNVEKGSPAVASGSFGAGSNIQETSISQMIKMMTKYNLPPTLNFADYGDSPFVMYFLEFDHKLDQKDLSDIWQGLTPTIGTRAERASQEFIHDLSTVDFFGGKTPPEDVRWLVFRVKQKAKTNYFQSYGKTLSDGRFDFNFNLGEDPAQYSYNWPYDFFSLIELSQIEGGVEIFDDETYDGVTSVFGPLPAEQKEKIYNAPIGRSSAAVTAKIKSDLESGQKKTGITGSEFGADGANE